MELFDTLSYYMQNAQVRNALIVGVLVALCASLLGVTLVLKRFSFIGDGLSHVAFGAMAISSVTGVLVSAWKPLIDSTNNMIIVMPITVLSAVLLLRTGQNAKIRGDAAVAMISVGALAVGYLLMHLDIFPSNGNVAGDVCTTLFGASNILTLTAGDVTFCIIAIIIAVIIVISMNFVGSLLVSALIIFPALSAMRVLKNFKAVTVCSACLSVLCASLGFFVSLLLETPLGATMVAVNIVCFGVFSLIEPSKTNNTATG